MTPPSPGEWLALPARWWAEVRAIRAAFRAGADSVAEDAAAEAELRRSAPRTVA